MHFLKYYIVLCNVYTFLECSTACPVDDRGTAGPAPAGLSAADGVDMERLADLVAARLKAPGQAGESCSFS